MARCGIAAKPDKGASAVVTMTESFVVKQCKKNDGYSTPELNETLYLHYFGFSQLSGLDSFVGCTVLHLNNNALSDLSGLAPLTLLSSLYLSFNALTSLDTLPSLPALRTLDVAHNALTGLGRLDTAAPGLQQLLASHNRIADLTGLEGCTALLSLDLSHNALEDEAAVDAVLQPLRSCMRTLMLHGNSLCRGAAHYRQRWVAAFAALRYLDEYPVFEDERERAEAFARGGAAAVREVRLAQKARHAEEAQKRFQYFGDFREASRDARRRGGGGGTPPGPTEYFLAHAAPAVEAARAAHNSDEDGGDVYIPSEAAAAVAQGSAHADPTQER